MSKPASPIKLRLFSKILISNDTTCWMWTAATNKQGYGQFRILNTVVPAHAAVYRFFGGTIAPGLVLDHLCRVTSCVNPEHLEPVTPAENTRRQNAAIGPPNSKKTACPQGHSYNPPRMESRGPVRRCPTCANESRRRYDQRRQVAA